MPGIETRELLVKIENATVRYRQDILFENLHFELKKGQHWAIVGESGSGKSALLKTMAGKFYLSKGKIDHIFYRDYISKHKVDDPFFTYHDLISYVDIRHDFRNLSNMRSFYYQQRYNSWDSDDAPTVEDYLIEKSKSEYWRGEWTVNKVMEDLHLERLKDKQLIKLSNGESKRLRLAAALLRNPILLLVDNPFTGLDVSTRNYFQQLFEKITKSGVTILMVTSTNEIPGVITHIAYLDRNHNLSTFTKEEFSKEKRDDKDESVTNISLPDELLSGFSRQGNETVIQMKNVKVKYDEIILDGVNWEIKRGERWALSGPNGSGKSTLLSLINGDHPQAYANDIQLFGKKRGTGESIWDLKRKIGFMSPELYQFFPDQYTCLEVVESGFYDTMGLFVSSDPEKAKLSEKWLSAVELAPLVHEVLGDISASQQRLCLLARALVKTPELLILDEPCQGMDFHQQNYFRNLIDAIASKSDITVIYVTHYQEELPKCITHQFEI